MRMIIMFMAGMRFLAVVLSLSIIGYEFMVGVSGPSQPVNPANAALTNVAMVAPENQPPWFNQTNDVSTIKDYMTSGYKTKGIAKPEVNALNDLGYTGLVSNVLVPNRDFVEQLIIYGADVNMAIAADNNNRPLHYAMQKGDQEWQSWNNDDKPGCIRLLLNANADPMLVNSPSGVPATFNEYTQIIVTGQTPLHLIEAYVMDLDIRMKIVQLLIDQVCKLHGEEAAKKFLNMQDSQGNTFMHVAASTSDAPWVDRIMQAPFLCLIDMTIKNKAGQTPLSGLRPEGISPSQEVTDEIAVMMKKYRSECPNKKIKICPEKKSR